MKIKNNNFLRSNIVKIVLKQKQIFKFGSQLFGVSFRSTAQMYLQLPLSGHVPEIQAEVEVVKIKNPDFSC